MKAVFFEEHGALDVLKYGDFPTPEIKPGWVLIKVEACGLNYLDIFSRKGMPGINIELPGITGGDCAGNIAELGEGIEDWNIGDRVLLNPAFIDDQNGYFEMLGESRPGAMAEFCTCRAEQLIKIPDNVSNEDAAALPVAYATAYRMLFTRGNLKSDERILILGASGGVGTACVSLAKMVGAHVIAAAGTDEKCERLLSLGADDTINYTTDSFEKVVRKKTGSMFRGGGYDVVVNFTGGDSWVKSLKCVKRGGRLLTCGATAGFDPTTDIRFIYMAEISIIGSTGFSRDEIVSCLKLVSENRLSPVIGVVLPLSKGADGIRLLENREVFGKVIIKPGLDS